MIFGIYLRKPISRFVFLCGLIITSCFFRQPSSFTPIPPETINEFFTRCPSAQEVERVNADLTLSFEYDPTAGILVCRQTQGSADLTALQKRAYQTIYVMRLLQFSRPLPWTDKQLYTWLIDTIDGVRFVSGGFSHCCEPENTIVISLNADPALLQTDRWVVEGKEYGLMDATLLYAHETRHNEGFHHTCTTRPGDDNTVDEMSAWAVQYNLALWIAQYSDREFLTASQASPETYRSAALQSAQFVYLTRFCQEQYTEPMETLLP